MTFYAAEQIFPFGRRGSLFICQRMHRCRALYQGEIQILEPINF